jgi:hypothetical protein
VSSSFSIGDEPTFENTPSVWRRRGESVPKLWHVWPSAGTGPIQAHVKGVEAVEAHCESQVAEDESYVVAEIAPSAVRYAVTVNGGGC